MKWCFLLGSPDIGGGTHVVLQHAQYAQQMGVDVTIVMERQVQQHRLNWFPQAKQLRWSTYGRERNTTFDVVIATWWKTVYLMSAISAGHYLYFVQSIESRIYDAGEEGQMRLAAATYSFPFLYVTEARWIAAYLKEQYGQDAVLVPNGVDKAAFTPKGTVAQRRNGSRLRVLVEGPVDVPFKNVPQTIKLCKEAGADEIWLLTSSPIHKYDGVDRVFSKVPLLKTPAVYRSCDVVVKLSYVEGMFGPPLEMFHCGGTAITYNVTGHDEYIVDRHNAIVVEKDDEATVIQSVQRLKSDKEYLITLQRNAAETAAAWPSWPQSSAQFYETVNGLLARPPYLSQTRLASLAEAAKRACTQTEGNRTKGPGQRKKALKRWIREKMPNLFHLMKSIKMKFKY